MQELGRIAEADASISAEKELVLEPVEEPLARRIAERTAPRKHMVNEPLPLHQAEHRLLLDLRDQGADAPT